MTTVPALARIPPQNLDAEQCVLGAMILEINAIAKAIEHVSADDFYREAHRIVFTAITELYERRHPVDLLTLSNLLKTRGNLDAIGGTLYLSTMMANVPTAHAVGHYAAIVREMAQRRLLIRAADDITNQAYDIGSKLEDVRNEAERAVMAVGETVQKAKGAVSIADLAKRVYYRTQDSVEKGESPGFKSGWNAINHLIRPLLPGQLITIGARPGMGKTTLAIQWAMDIGRDIAKPRHSQVFSMEMDGEELALRALLAEMHHVQDDIDALNENAVTDMNHAVEKVWMATVHIDDTPGLRVSDMGRAIRSHKRKVGKPDLIIVDFLQQAKAEKRHNSLGEEIGALVYALHDLAKEEQVTIFALSQLVREVDKQDIKRPGMNHFHGGGMIEAASDVVLYLFRPGYYGDDDVTRMGWNPLLHRAVTEIGVLKNRQGIPCSRSLMVYEGAHYRFRDLHHEEWESLRREK